MDQSTFHKQMLDRYAENIATEDELEVLGQLMRTGELEETLMKHMEENWQGEEAAFDLEVNTVQLKVRRHKLWPFITAAAALAAIMFGLWFYSYHPITDRYSQNVNQNDISPGKNTATITLADGTKISLSEAKNGVVIGDDLRYSDGTIIKDQALPSGRLSSQTRERTAMLTASTPRGGTYQVILPDGTHVWLNADSRISFPVQFSEGPRKILLSGEAYFEVKKDERHPFIVSSKGQEVTVLGTHFNVNSYADEENIETTLLEGAVKVSAGDHKQILKPGERAINNGTSIKVLSANLDGIMDWKEGDFYLNRVNFKTAMRKIARWYDLEVIYDPSVPNDLQSGGWISRDQPLSVILKLIESSGQVHFQRKGRSLYVSGGR
jgi:transmembrane sensor